MNINAYINHCLDDKGWKTGHYGSLRYSDTDGYWVKSIRDWLKLNNDAMPVKIEVREPSIDVKKLESLL